MSGAGSLLIAEFDNLAEVEICACEDDAEPNSWLRQKCENSFAKMLEQLY